MVDKMQVNKILLMMTVLPNCPIREDNMDLAVDVYHIVLKDMDWQTLKMAAAQYLSRGTFFPTPGNLRETGLELMLSTRGIPTPGEAWGAVRTARKTEPMVICDTSQMLRDRICGNQVSYWRGLEELKKHEAACGICLPSRIVETYPHPLVAEVVRRLGGYETLFTDNEAADRARFIEAYEVILDKESKEAGRIPEVADWLDARRNDLETGTHEEIKRLGAKSSAGGEDGKGSTE